MDTIRIMCPSLICRRILAVPTSSRGKNVRCKNCGATIRVPEKLAGGLVIPAGAAGEGDSSAKSGKADSAKQSKPAA